MNTLLPSSLIGLFLVSLSARAVTVEPAEMTVARDWVSARLSLSQETPSSNQVPFSFVYRGKSSRDFLKNWTSQVTTREFDPDRTELVLTWRAPDEKLEVRCVTMVYRDFPTVEWTLYFKNSGTNETGILEQIEPLDITVERGGKGEFLLHHNIGSPADGNDYGPQETILTPELTRRISAAGGRPTNTDWSYFNLEWSGNGLIVAVGWPGQWAADFRRDRDRQLHWRAGQELTHFKLLPGEEVRSPLMVLQFWIGDWIRAQNIWRRWMMAHSMPKPSGRLPQPQFVASSSRQFDEMIKANETNQILFIRRYLAEDLKLDYWWMDAGWYVNDGAGWPKVGTWEVDTNRFPHGLRGVSDFAHAKGMKILVWFEPERVAAGTWLAEHHPEWILGGAKGGLLNLGDEQARRWLTEHVDQLITSQGIDLYRQDFNMDPLSYWRGNDAPDRQGITEIKHVTGYLAYWDELRARHPAMLIDSCASGGRRNDIESMRRAVPLWRSDYAYEAVGHQCMTYGISLWLSYYGTGTVFCHDAPYYGSGATPVEPYAFWSNVSPSLGCGIDIRVPEIDYGRIRRLIAAWRQINPDYYGDFYPLTPWTRDASVWIGWQFDRPEAGKGMVQVFRRDKSVYEAARLKLRGLQAGSSYSIRNLDSEATIRATGRELMEQGLLVSLKQQPEAAVFTYEVAR